MLHTPFYDPNKSYEINYDQGPFGEFSDTKVYNQKGVPEYNFLRQKVYLPFGIPAGPVLNNKFVKASFDKGFDLVVYKTVRSSFFPCHPHPNVLSVKINGDLTLEKAKGQLIASNKYTEPLSITNSFGVPSADPDVWQPDMKKAVENAGMGQVLIGSFQGTKSGNGSVKEYIDNFVLAAKLVKETGAKVMEANLSCPNEGNADLLCFDVERTKKIAQAIKNEIGNIPLILKMAYFPQDKLENFVNNLGKIADGLAAINTIASTIVDKDGNQALPGEGRARSGVCGAAIKWAGLDMVKRLKKIRDENDYSYTIIGVGGVTKPQDYFDYVNAGADAVMSATGAMWNSHLAQEIKEFRI